MWILDHFKILLCLLSKLLWDGLLRKCLHLFWYIIPANKQGVICIFLNKLNGCYVGKLFNPGTEKLMTAHVRRTWLLQRCSSLQTAPPRTVQCTIPNDSMCCMPWLYQCKAFFILSLSLLVPGTTLADVRGTETSGSSSTGEKTIQKEGHKAPSVCQCHKFLPPSLSFICSSPLLSEATTSAGFCGTMATGNNAGRSNRSGWLLSGDKLQFQLVSW